LEIKTSVTSALKMSENGQITEQYLWRSL